MATFTAMTFEQVQGLGSLLNYLHWLESDTDFYGSGDCIQHPPDIEEITSALCYYMHCNEEERVKEFRRRDAASESFDYGASGNMDTLINC